jgi:indole-3-glycerol phosphate synthase
VDSYQLYEAVAAGADAVLLIVAALEQEQLASLHLEARSIGLDVLVEVHDSDELQRALAVGAEIVGVNNRDLRDFSVDVRRTERLMDEIPSGAIVVSESGIVDAAQLSSLRERGVQAVLVGEALMRSGDPEAALRELRSAKS